MLLSSIGKQATGNNAFQMNFSYKPYDETGVQKSMKDIFFGISIAQTSGIIILFFQLSLVGVHTLKALNGTYKAGILKKMSPGAFICGSVIVELIANVVIFEAFFLICLLFCVNTDSWQWLGLGWAAAQTTANGFYNTAFAYKGKQGYQQLYIFAEFLFIAIIQTFFKGYLSVGGQQTALIGCYFCLPLPLSQFLFGLIMVSYRYEVYSEENSNLGQGADYVTPFSEYGARIPMIIIGAQACAYALLIIYDSNYGVHAVKTEKVNQYNCPSGE